MNENSNTPDPYSIYAFFDPRWKIKEKEILHRDHYRCVICKSEKKLQVHHKQYHFSIALNAFRDPWNYDNQFLITLCKRCHREGHRLYNVPVKQVDI